MRQWERHGQGALTVPKRSWKHPEDAGKRIPWPMLEEGDESTAYRVIGRDGWPRGEVLSLWLEQDWDDAVGGTTGGTDRHEGVIRRPIRNGQVCCDLHEEFDQPIPDEAAAPVMSLEDMIDEASLTDRQREVVEMLAAGLSESAIADLLGCSRPNVQQHKALAFRKLQNALDTIQT